MTDHNFLIFIPHLRFSKHELLYGVVLNYNNGTAIYILGTCCGCQCKYSSRYKILGAISHVTTKKKKNSELWISVVSSGNYSMNKVCVQTKLKKYNVSVIQYNKLHIKESQLLYFNYWHGRPEQSDYIFCLIQEIQREPEICCMKSTTRNGIIWYNILSSLYSFLSKVSNRLKLPWISYVIKTSSFGSHFVNILETLVSMLQQTLHDQYLSVQFINYTLARLLDMILGIIIIYYVFSFTTSNELFFILINFQEHVVTYLKNIVEWLMGSPAGFKLYCPLNNVLGVFYQFHISLWWTFLKLLNPFLRIAFNFFLFLGHFGLSFQVSILADLLAVISVHMYCIYVYAARLYFFQMEGLKILSRLFIGKKRNPHRGSVHSSPYTTEQLLFGTVSFTILLFLLPTTIVYYSVFTAIRIFLIFIGGLFTRLKFFMNIFPIYLTILRFYNPKKLTCSVRLNICTDYLPDGTQIIQVEPVCASWWQTVNSCIPQSIEKPDGIEWKKLITDILVGNLIYPV